jgi:hypothetical protein
MMFQRRQWESRAKAQCICASVTIEPAIVHDLGAYVKNIVLNIIGLLLVKHRSHEVSAGHLNRDIHIGRLPSLRAILTPAPSV